MDQSNNSTFQPITVLEIDHKAGEEWKKAGVVFCENNGWDWEGNAYLLITGDEPGEIAGLEDQLKKRNINLYDFTKEVPGYITSLFGFDDLDYEGDYEYTFEEMDPAVLKVCEKIMDDLGIRWCGWSGAPSFTLAATEEQFKELIKRLEKPYEQWRNISITGFPDDWEDEDD